MDEKAALAEIERHFKAIAQLEARRRSAR